MTSKERREGRYQRRKAKREKRKAELNQLYGDFDKVISFDSLNSAYYKCKKGVSWKGSVQRYGFNLYSNSIKALDAVTSGKYKQKPFFEFDLFERGKERHIRSIHISDRCIQKALCDNALIPMMENNLIYDNSASQKGKGVHFALKRLYKHMRDYYRKNGSEGYVIKGDFKSYFDSIDHDVLYEIIKKSFYDERIISLCKKTIDPFGEKGLGLGSQVSQILSVRYASALDHFVKTKLGIKAYGRYVDDFYLIVKTKEEARCILNQIRSEVKKLHLELNEKKTQIIKLSKGFTFLKTRVFYTKTGRIIKCICRESIIRQRRKLKKMHKMLLRGEMCFNDIDTSYRSWRGYARHKHAWNTVSNMDQLFNDLFVRDFICSYMQEDTA